MAVDEAIFEYFKKKNSLPTLRFYRFKPPAITIGRYQKINECLSYCHSKRSKESCLNIVRRPTGGRAVIHDGDITYSFVFYASSLYEGYKKIAEIFANALSKFNIEAKICKIKNTDSHKDVLCFNSIARYELQINNKKILGSAQKKENNIILQQGSLFVDIDIESFISAVKQTLESMKINVIENNLNDEEINLANKLINKYKSKEWNYLL